MKKTKIVCTIGPASENKETMKSLIEAGMNVMRMNFSHGDFVEQGFRIKNLKELNKENNWHVGMMLDTKGPEIRTGELADNGYGGVELTKGDIIRLTMDYSFKGNKDKVAISYPGLYDDINVGGRILIEDGLLTLTVIEKDETCRELVCRIENNRKLKNKRNCNVPGVILNMEYISPKDKGDIEFACDNDCDFIAASFVRRAQDIKDIREILKDKGNDHIKIISKIENQEGVSNMDEIIELSDGVMVARGDLGVDVDAWDLPAIQKEMIAKAQQAGKIVITATQMLDSMQANPKPTRAEVTDCHNAVLDGTSATMLSGESAQGDYPLEAVTYMAKIDERAEEFINYDELMENALQGVYECSNEEALGCAIAKVAYEFGTSAIIAEGEELAWALSHYRPCANVIAYVGCERCARSLSLAWGVTAIVGSYEEAYKFACEKLELTEGDSVIKATKDGFTFVNVK